MFLVRLFCFKIQQSLILCCIALMLVQLEILRHYWLFHTLDFKVIPFLLSGVLDFCLLCLSKFRVCRSPQRTVDPLWHLWPAYALADAYAPICMDYIRRGKAICTLLDVQRKRQGKKIPLQHLSNLALLSATWKKVIKRKSAYSSRQDSYILKGWNN